FSPVFMGDDIIRVVGACTIVFEWPDRMAWKEFASDRAILSIWRTIDARKDAIQIGIRHSPLRPKPHADSCFRIDHQLGAPEVNEIVLGYVVPGRKEELCGDDFCRCRHFGIVWRIELDEIDIAAPIANAKPRRYAFRFSVDHHP